MPPGRSPPGGAGGLTSQPMEYLMADFYTIITATVIDEDGDSDEDGE